MEAMSECLSDRVPHSIVLSNPGLYVTRDRNALSLDLYKLVMLNNMVRITVFQHITSALSYLSRNYLVMTARFIKTALSFAC